MAGAFISRQEKSSWGIPCNQRSDGELFVGKGYGTTFVSQLPDLALQSWNSIRASTANDMRIMMLP